MGKSYGLKADYNYSDNTVYFSTIENLNNGINLEKLKQKNYYIFLRIAYSNSDVKYYSLCNKTEYENITYYTVTKNNKNDKILISFNNYKNIPYLSVNADESNSLPDNVYDIAIDLGVTKQKQSENELILKCGETLKNSLENVGFKVFITRDNLQKVDTDTNMYDEDGRINILNSSRAKILISLDLSNNSYSKKNGGVEVYAPNDVDLNFAKIMAQNIVEKANAKYSKNNSFKKDERSICKKLYKFRYSSSK